MRDNYPKANLLNQVVWPYDSGDVIESDGIVYFLNDQVPGKQKRKKKKKKKKKKKDNNNNNNNKRKNGRNLNETVKVLENKKSPSFTDMNRVIARAMASVLLPATNAEDGRSVQFSESVTHLFSHPGYKFSTIRRIPQAPSSSKPFNSNTWNYLMKHLQQMQIADGFMEEKINWRIRLKSTHSHHQQHGSRINRAVAAIVCLRGKDSLSAGLKEPFFTSPDMYPRYSLRNPHAVSHSISSSSPSS
eukprot:jgi/Bigna1/136099/aug1.32_g10807